jgi:hypothetical protein
LRDQGEEIGVDLVLARCAQAMVTASIDLELVVLDQLGCVMAA